MMAPLLFRAMGTVISLHTADPLHRADAAAVREVFEEFEDRFSLYRPGSEGARVAARALPLRGASAAFRAVYDEAVLWRTRTHGAFTPHRPDGVIDLAGLVKALAIRDAGAALAAHGVDHWCLNAGGDVLTSGTRSDGSDWLVGIVDPVDRTTMLSQVTARSGRRAVATSGTAERGEHLWRLGADATFSQVSVCAADIVTADVLATAIVAGGPSMLDEAQALAPIDVLACGADGRFWASGVFLASPEREPLAVPRPLWRPGA